MSKEDFVSFEQAQKLKALGFNEPVFFRYDKNGKFETNKWAIDDAGYVCADELCYDCNNFEFYCSAPTLSQACKWLREEKGMHVVIDTYFPKYKENDYSVCFYECIVVEQYDKAIRTRIATYESYEQAQSAGIDVALGLLEKGAKNFIKLLKIE